MLLLLALSDQLPPDPAFPKIAECMVGHVGAELSQMFDEFMSKVQANEHLIRVFYSLVDSRYDQ